VKGPLQNFDFIIDGEIQAETYSLEAEAPMGQSAVVFIVPQKELVFNPTDQINRPVYTGSRLVAVWVA
jgi:hypothetical protein